MAWKSRKVEPQCNSAVWDELDCVQQQAVLTEMGHIVSELQAHGLIDSETNGSLNRAPKLRPARRFEYPA